MASLRDTVKDYQEELRDGIAWVAFWKTGRSWNAEYFHLEMGDYLYPEDRSRMEEIKQADPAAVVVNGYYSGYLGEDRNLDELTAGVRLPRVPVCSVICGHRLPKSEAWHRSLSIRFSVLSALRR